jgi:uncharacterized C2H2 Zn-finger protein
MKNLDFHNQQHGYMHANNLLTSYALKDEDLASKDSSSTRMSNTSRDSKSQTDMNRDVLTRDSNTCVFCNRQNPDLTLIGAHVFNRAERKDLADGDWLQTLIDLKFGHLYGVSNGLCLCSTCHDLYDANLICLKIEEGKYFVECSEAARFDSFCPCREHAKSIHRKLITPKIPQLWPSTSLLEHRWRRYLENLDRIKTNPEEQYRCPNCARLFKTACGLVKHYKTASCYNQQKEIATVGKHILRWVRFPDQDRDVRSYEALGAANAEMEQEVIEALQGLPI